MGQSSEDAAVETVEAPADSAVAEPTVSDSLLQVKQDSLDELLSEAIEVSGETDGYWSEDAPYLITSTVTISAEDTLYHRRRNANLFRGAEKR